MKKKINKIKIKKSVNLNQSKKADKPQVKKSDKKERADALKEAKRVRKEQNIINVEQSIAKLSKALLSMGGVKREKLSEKDKEIIQQKTEELRKARKELYENRKLASLKRRLKQGEKSEEEIKKSLDELKKEMAEQKRYDILTIFHPNDKAAISATLANTKIAVTLMSDDYLWIKNTDVHILDKLRKLPFKVNIWPYKASEKAPAATKSKKRTNNTSEVITAAKAKSKANNLKRFKA